MLTAGVTGWRRRRRGAGDRGGVSRAEVSPARGRCKSARSVVEWKRTLPSVWHRLSRSGHEDGDVVGRAGGQRGQQGVAGFGDGQVADGRKGAGQACHSGGHVGGGAFDEPVGVQDQGAVAGHVQAGGLVVPAAGDVDAQGQAGGQVGEGGAVARAGDGRRGVPGPGDVPVCGGGVVDGVDAGGAGFLVGEVGGDLVEAGEYRCGREVEGGQGAGGGAELAHEGGGADVVSGHVADGQGGAAAGQGDDIEPVAADLGRGLRGGVAAGELEAGNVGDRAGQQGALEGERGGPLAGVVPGVVYGDRGPGGQVTGQRP